MHDLRGNFFIDGRTKESKRKGEKGKENVGTKEEEEEKAAGKRGRWHREDGGNEAENTHKENTEKAQRERKAQGRR